MASIAKITQSTAVSDDVTVGTPADGTFSLIAQALGAGARFVAPAAKREAEELGRASIVRDPNGNIRSEQISPLALPFRGQAQAAAALAMRSEIEVDAYTRLQQMETESNFDPDAFRNSAASYTEQIVGDAPEYMRGEIREFLETQVNSRAMGLVDHQRRETLKRADNSSRALLDRMQQDLMGLFAAGNADAIEARILEANALLAAREKMPGIAWTGEDSENWVSQVLQDGSLLQAETLISNGGDLGNVERLIQSGDISPDAIPVLQRKLVAERRYRAALASEARAQQADASADGFARRIFSTTPQAEWFDRASQIEDPDLRSAVSAKLVGLHAAASKESAIIRDGLERRMVEGEDLRVSDILGNSNLTDADRTALVDEILSADEAKRKGWEAQGRLDMMSTLNPGMAEHVEIANLAYSATTDGESILSSPASYSVASSMVEKGVLPDLAKSDLRRGINSADPQERLAAYQIASAFQVLNPQVFALDQDLKDSLSAFDTWSAASSPVQAIEHIMALEDPAVESQQSVIQAQIKDTLEGIGVSDARDAAGATRMTREETGFTPELEAQLLLDLKSRVEDHMKRGVPAKDAKKMAKHDISQMYGPTTVTGNRVLMKHPPEKVYAGVNADFMKEDLLRSARAEFGDDVEEGDIVLVADYDTLRQIREGSNQPRYRIFIRSEIAGIPQIDYGRSAQWYVDREAARDYSSQKMAERMADQQAAVDRVSHHYQKNR